MKRRIIFAALLVVVLGGLTWVVFSMQGPPEPFYKSKPLRYWLAGYDRPHYNEAHPRGPLPPNEADATDALRWIGTNAFPTLLRLLRERDSAAKTFYFKLMREQHFFPVEVRSANMQTYKAQRAFQAIGGPLATDLAPELIAIYNSPTCAASGRVVPEILGYVAPYARETVPFLLRVLAEDKDAVARANAAIAIRNIRPPAEQVVPALTKALEDPDRGVRRSAVAALGVYVYGLGVEPAVPALHRLLASEKTLGPPPIPARTVTNFVVTLRQPQTGAMVTVTAPPGKMIGMPGGSINLTGELEELLKSIDAEVAAQAGVK